MSQRRLPPPPLLADGAAVLERAVGFAPLLASETAGWRDLHLRLWQGHVDTCAYGAYREVMLVFQIGGGRVRMNKDGRRIGHCSVPGLLTILPPRTPVTWEVAGAVQSCTLHLPPERFANLLTDADGLRMAQDLAFEFACREPFIGATIDLLINELRLPTQRGPLYAETLADAVSMHLLQRHRSCGRAEKVTGGLSRSAHNRVCERIEAAIEDGISLDELARTAGLSRSYFTRAFRRSSGMSACQYLQQRRIERASDLLLRSKRSIAEVALACGFSNQSHFAECFRRTMGVTPLRFRQTGHQ